MSKIVKQHDFNEAFEISKNGGNVFALVARVNNDTPIIKNIANMSIKGLLDLKDDVIYVTFEEA